MRRPLPLLLAAAVPAAALFAVPAVTDAATTRTVTIKDTAFKPSSLTVASGDRVTWRWADGRSPHNVSPRGTRRFKRASTRTTGTHTVRFFTRGTYRYVCTIHTGMAGKVVVR